ncbi:MAG: hypothetical protein IKI88_03275 [Anaerotignum sp.]|nr:hypothetical protein [Anaerotignum sp.]
MESWKKRRGSRWKINGDTMTTIVVYSLLFCVMVVVAGMMLGAWGRDVSAVVDSALRIFGTELGICGIMTIFQRWIAAQDRRQEERKKQRETKRKDEKDDIFG